MKKLIFAALFLFIQAAPILGQNLTEAELDAKVDSVLQLMTLQEKVGQMNLLTSGLAKTGPTMRDDYKKLIKSGKVGAIFNAFGAEYTRNLQEMAINETRLGIPLLFGFDVIHGFRTIFPIPLGQSASWNLELIEKSARVAARETAASGAHWTYSPMIDISRDPRWGRIMEGAGEDPFLTSKVAAAMVHGYQGKDLSNLYTILATAKHFVGYGAAEGGRDYNTVNMSERRLREIYLPPFKAALEAGVATFMASFNSYNGIPATGSEFLLNEILRQEWGFDGMMVTDYTAIPEMITHGVPSNEAEAAKMALEANVDMDMQSSIYMNELPSLVKKGVVSKKEINEAVRRILKLKFKLGLFKDPFRYSNKERQERVILSDKNQAVALQMARESIVLLKNKQDLLPLDEEIESIAVIGPLAKNKKDLLGAWSGAGQWQDATTLLKGIKKELSDDVEVNFAKGTSITGDDTSGFDEAVELANNAEVAIVALGEERLMSGEAASRATLDLPGNQLQLLKAIHATGTPVVLVLMNGRPLAINWADKHIPAILETWFLGTEAGPAIADVLFGHYNPSGHLTVTFPRTVGQVPIYYAHKNTGRPFDPDEKYTSKYIDIKNGPLYHFGYGLSYTTFNYSDLSLSSKKIDKTDSVQVSVTVKNTGDRAGQEVVQLYFQDLFASVVRPVKELHGFDKIYLEPGESKRVTFTLTPEDFAFYNVDMEKVVEPGKFIIMAGSSSRDKDLLKTPLIITE